MFGRRCAEDINQDLGGKKESRQPLEPVLPLEEEENGLTPPLTRVETEELRARIKERMTADCGVIRRGGRMEQALEEIQAVYDRVSGSLIHNQRETELLNIATVAKGMLEGAIARKESVGAHYRID